LDAVGNRSFKYKYSTVGCQVLALVSFERRSVVSILVVVKAERFYEASGVVCQREDKVVHPLMLGYLLRKLSDSFVSFPVLV